MNGLIEAERHLLEAAVANPDSSVRLCFRHRMKPVAGAEAVLALADHLVDQWMMTYHGQEGGRSDPFEPISAVYKVTSYGRARLEIDAGALELDADHLEHPGCY